MCNNLLNGFNNGPIRSREEGERNRKAELKAERKIAKSERKQQNLAYFVNTFLIGMIERELVKPTPNVAFISGLVPELMPRTMPGGMMDAIAKHYANATERSSYSSAKLESIMNELRPMSQSFTSKLAEAMGLVEELSNKPHFAYNPGPVVFEDNMRSASDMPEPRPRLPYTEQIAKYREMLDGDFLANFEATIDAMLDTSLGNRPAMIGALKMLKEVYRAEMGFERTPEDIRLMLSAAESQKEREHIYYNILSEYERELVQLNPEENEAGSYDREQHRKFRKIGFDDVFDASFSKELFKLTERLKGAADAMSQINKVRPMERVDFGPVEVTEVGPEVVLPHSLLSSFQERAFKIRKRDIEHQHSPMYWEDTYGPFAAIAKKLHEGNAMTQEDVYFYLQNRNTKYAEAIEGAMLAFGRDKFGA